MPGCPGGRGGGCRSARAALLGAWLTAIPEQPPCWQPHLCSLRFPESLERPPRSQGRPACRGPCLGHGSPSPRSRGALARTGTGGLERVGPAVRTSRDAGQSGRRCVDEVRPTSNVTDVKASHPAAPSKEGPAAALGGGRQGPHPQGAGPGPPGA